MATQQQTVQTVGFIGLGAMGSGMARNLLAHLKEHGSTLHVYNRTLSKAADLVAAGAKLESGGPTALARSCDVIVSMVFDDQAVNETLDALIAGPPKQNLIYVECATVHPNTIKSAAEKASQHGIRMLSCPVFGRPDAAQAKRLVSALAGPPSDRDAVRPIISAFSRAVMDIGDMPHLANVMKLAGNFTLLGMIETMAEAQTLADKNGVNRHTYMEWVNLLFSNAVVMGGYGTRMANDAFEIESGQGFPVRGGIKDAELIRKVASETGVHVPIADVAVNHLRQQERDGHLDLDWGSLAMAVRKESGL